MRILVNDFTCKYCKKTFSGNFSKSKKVCSICLKKNKEKASTKRNTSTSTTGTISELLVSADLLQKGFQVFKALSPNSNVDLIIKNENSYLGVEVKTSYKRQDGSLHFPKPYHPFDILALVILPQGEITYLPEVSKVI